MNIIKLTHKFSIFILSLLIITSCYNFLFFTERAFALTCYDLDGSYVYSQESPPVYLGFFGSAYASESIMNLYGSYGSNYSSSSVRNEYGAYGSPYRTYSATNDYTSTPPGIYKNGYLIAYLTTNTLIYDGVSLSEIDASCTFYSSTPSIEVQLPLSPSWIVASDGIYTDKIAISWGAVSGVSYYNIYYADSLTGTIYYIDSTTSTFMDMIGGTPDKIYYFWISSVNAGGESALSSPDSGYIASALDNIPPTGSVSYSTTDPTNGSVIATLQTSEDVTITSSGGNSHTFTDNGSFTFYFQDAAGNTGSATATVDWIIVIVDIDGDGVPDDQDTFPNDPAESVDTDGDGIGNNADTDDDNDGMPDNWEMAYELNSFLNDADEDPDGDNFNNFVEYQKGTNPRDAQSHPPVGMPWIPLLLLDY
ncbi:hypothetical protein ACFL7E_02530 [Thermodesulfobacteriota bacterium]